MKHSAPKISPELVARFYRLIQSQGRGQVHALKALLVANQLGLNGTRENKERAVRALHNACIENDWAVCSGNAGYWCPANMDEVEESTRRWLSQAADMNRKAQRLKTAAARELAQKPLSRHVSPAQISLGV